MRLFLCLHFDTVTNIEAKVEASIFLVVSYFCEELMQQHLISHFIGKLRSHIDGLLVDEQILIYRINAVVFEHCH